MSLRIGDRVWYGSKLCRVSRDYCSGMYKIDQLPHRVFSYTVYEDEVSIHDRECVECQRAHVLPDAERGRCEECLLQVKA